MGARVYNSVNQNVRAVTFCRIPGSCTDLPSLRCKRAVLTKSESVCKGSPANQSVWEPVVTRPFSWASKPCLLGKKVVSRSSDLGPHVAPWRHLLPYCLDGGCTAFSGYFPCRGWTPRGVSKVGLVKCVRRCWFRLLTATSFEVIREMSLWRLCAVKNRN